MAIDGVKIIDSDDAYDIYNAIVERYGALNYRVGVGGL